MLAPLSPYPTYLWLWPSSSILFSPYRLSLCILIILLYPIARLLGFIAINTNQSDLREHCRLENAEISLLPCMAKKEKGEGSGFEVGMGLVDGWLDGCALGKEVVVVEEAPTNHKLPYPCFIQLRWEREGQQQLAAAYGGCHRSDGFTFISG